MATVDLKEHHIESYPLPITSPNPTLAVNGCAGRGEIPGAQEGERGGKEKAEAKAKEKAWRTRSRRAPWNPLAVTRECNLTSLLARTVVADNGPRGRQVWYFIQYSTLPLCILIVEA